MRRTMREAQNVGKLTSTPIVAGVGVSSTSNRLCVYDQDTREKYLVDTGADISVLAARGKKPTTSCSYKLYAANNTPIQTYGVKTLTLNLGLRRNYRWTFIIADVKTSILGADFLRTHKLLVDLHNKKIVDHVTELSVNTIEVQSEQPTVYMVSREHSYHDILKQYPDVLRPMSLKTAEKHSVVHHIETAGPAIYAKPRPLAPDKYKIAKDEFERLMEMGICEPSKSPWASPLHVVKKKDGGLRVCGDYRRLNAVTLPDRYPIPRIQDFTYQLSGKKIFTKLDLKKAYYWIPMAKEDAQKTAITTPFGLFEFNCMTFGLRNASQTFQRFIHQVLRGLDCCFPYIDDILIYSEDENQHKHNLQEVLERLNKYGVTLNIEKCEFGKRKLNFLGYEVSALGIKPTEERIHAISTYPKPSTIQELRRFLGMINFYRDCLPHQAELQAELNKFLHNKKKNDKSTIEWTTTAESAFTACRQSILEATTLTHPIHGVPLYLMTDASNTSLGAVLHQKVDNALQPLAFYSKAMSETQRRYSVYDRELLAIYTAVKHFRRLIEGNDVIVCTDHKPLSFALSRPPSSSDTPRRERQLSFISQFCSSIQYIQGENNEVADALSRIEEIECPNAIDYQKLAADQEQDDDLKILKTKHHLKFCDVTLPGLHRPITCEMSTHCPRPYLPPAYRKAAFKAQHELSHPGVRTTRKLLSSKFFWPHMNQEVGSWAKACISCQRAKVHRHVSSPLGEFPESQRFEHIHVDIVGKLKMSNECSYVVTMIDRFTKWPEAIPVRDITAETVAKAIYDGWIARFGCPLRITTDQGRQFESDLFNALMKRFGITRIRTTAYHPQANGQVERWHRTLKAALMARGTTTQWTEELPTVLLGLRTALRKENNLSPSLMTYGSTLRIPSDFFVPTKSRVDDAEFVRRLSETMASLSPAKSTCAQHQTFVPTDIETCTHVFVRNDTVRSPLTPPYDGPYAVIARSGKHFTLQLPRRTSVVSIDRLKPAFMVEDEPTSNVKNPTLPEKQRTTPRTEPAHVETRSIQAPAATTPSPYVTRAGRVTKKTVRFA